MRSRRNQGKAHQERTRSKFDETSISPLDPGWMRAFRGIDRSKGGNILAQVASIFSSKVPDLLENLKKALRENDSEAAEETAHSLASLYNSVGALKLSESCSELEALLAAGEQEEAISRLLKEAESGYQEVQKALEQQLTQHDRDEA